MSNSEPVTMTTGCLAAALGATIPFAYPDVSIPSLHGVQVHAGGGLFTATATDRYVIGHAQRSATGSLPRRYLLHVANAQRLLDSLTKYMDIRESRADRVTITPTDDQGLRFEFSDVALTLTEPSYVDTIPNLSTPLASLPTNDANGIGMPIGVGPNVLRPLLEAAAWEPFEPLRWLFGGPHSAFRVEIAEWFVAAVMPTRLQGARPNVVAEFPESSALRGESPAVAS
jgi:hypothetical protein